MYEFRNSLQNKIYSSITLAGGGGRTQSFFANHDQSCTNLLLVTIQPVKYSEKSQQRVKQI